MGYTTRAQALVVFDHVRLYLDRMHATFDPDQLIRLRRRRGLTQLDVAEALGVTQQAVSEWERGRKRPEINSLPILAEVLGCELIELFSVRLAA